MTIHFRSNSDEWPTPQALFDRLHAEFRFTLDVCATAENAKCARFYDKEQDGLAQDWNGEVVWMNPPYGHGIKHWMQKAYETGTPAEPVVCLVPANTSTRWWHRYAMKAGEIRLLDKKLQFIGAKHRAPFSSAVVVFGPPGFKVTAMKVPT